MMDGDTDRWTNKQPNDSGSVGKDYVGEEKRREDNSRVERSVHQDYSYDYD